MIVHTAGQRAEVKLFGRFYFIFSFLHFFPFLAWEQSPVCASLCLSCPSLRPSVPLPPRPRPRPRPSNHPQQPLFLSVTHGLIWHCGSTYQSLLLHLSAQHTLHLSCNWVLICTDKTVMEWQWSERLWNKRTLMIKYFFLKWQVTGPKVWSRAHRIKDVICAVAITDATIKTLHTTTSHFDPVPCEHVSVDDGVSRWMTTDDRMWNL